MVNLKVNSTQFIWLFKWTGIQSETTYVPPYYRDLIQQLADRLDMRNKLFGDSPQGIRCIGASDSTVSYFKIELSVEKDVLHIRELKNDHEYMYYYHYSQITYLQKEVSK